MAKVEPLYNLLNQKLQAYGILHKDLSIDKSMVPYYGRKDRVMKCPLIDMKIPNITYCTAIILLIIVSIL